MAVVGGTPAAGTAISVPNTPGTVQIVAANDNRRYLQLQNMGTVAVYVGGGTPVGTASGWPIAGGATWPTIPANVGGGAWYGIASSGTVEVRVMELG